MLDRALEQHRLLAIFNSLPMRDLLVDKITGDGNIDDKFRNQTEAIFRQNAGNRWRNNEYSLISENQQDDYLVFEWLEELFDKYYDFDGFRVVAKLEHLEEYNALCRDVNPFYLIACHMAKMLASGCLTPDRAEDISENITGLAVDFKHNKIHAENHSHLGGCFTCNRELLLLTEHNAKRLTPDKIKDLPCHLLDNFSLSPESELRMLPQLLGFMVRSVIGFDPPIDRFIRVLEQVKQNHYFNSRLFAMSLSDLPRIRHLTGISTEFKLLQLAAKQFNKGYYDSAMLLLLCAVFMVWESGAGKTRLIAWLFLLQMNFLRSGIVMSDGCGLNEFVKYYGSKIKTKTNDNTPLTNILVSGTKKIEFRTADLFPSQEFIGPLKAIGKTLKKHHPDYLHLDDGIWSEHGIPHPAQQSIQMMYGFHFKKNKKPAKVNHNIRLNLRSKEKYHEFHRQTNELIKFINRRNNIISLHRLFRSELCGKNADELKQYIFYGARLLRIVDAAGDENLVEPEVYAPFARRLRRVLHNIDKNNPADKKLRNLRFAFHAGEDFCHIVSGMRHVHETIHFMDYQHHDRLGHALAIGLDPEKWLAAKGEIIIPNHELFDNYVWLWYMSLEATKFCPEANNWSDYYEEKAMALAKDVYPDFTNCNIRKFHEAWRLRRNHPEPNRYKCPDYAPDFVNGHDAHDNQVIDISDYYFYMLEGCNKKAYQYQTLRYEDFFKSHDSKAMIGKSEVGFWHLIQDYLLRMCEEKGIIIEANPSSNVYISEFDRYHDHPIFRWSPICSDELKPGQKYNKFGLRRGPIEACINTDDQGIFSTTLQNEFNLLRNSAKCQFTYNVNQIEDWLERLRLKGIEIFDENYISPYEKE